MVDATLIVCEDIREEAGGKKSLMGIFRGDIICPSLPIQIPKLCFRATFRTEKKAPIRSLEFEVETLGTPLFKMPVAEEQLKNMAQLYDNPEATHLEYIVELVAAPITLTKEGPIRVWARINNRRKRVGGVWVKLRASEPKQATQTKAKRKTVKKSSKRRAGKASPRKP